MKFGVFDHLDCSGTDIGTHLRNRLKVVEAYDRCGVHSYHVAEHHGTPLGYAPSPSVYLSAVIQRTKRMRIGPLIYLLPLYHPLRLIEEISMLDHMSEGRFMLGVGRGASPIEMGFFGVKAEEQHDRYVECMEIVKRGLQCEQLTYEGKYHSFNNVPMTMPPYQKPYPELWYGVRSPESVIWAAENAINVVTLSLGERAKAITDQYRKTWMDAGKRAEDLPLMGASRHIVVAETDREAKAIAAGAYRKWRESFAKLWLEYGVALPLLNFYPDTWEALEAIGNGSAGSPETVKRFALQEVETTGVNYLVSWFAFGDLKPEHSIRSAELFSRHVAPAFG